MWSRIQARSGAEHLTQPYYAGGDCQIGPGGRVPRAGSDGCTDPIESTMRIPRAAGLISARSPPREPAAEERWTGGGSYNQTGAEGILRMQGLPSRVQGGVTPRKY
jgi:hypothetical protein